MYIFVPMIFFIGVFFVKMSRNSLPVEFSVYVAPFNFGFYVFASHSVYYTSLPCLFGEYSVNTITK